MEAVSRGASEAGAHVIGITCDEIERWRPIGPNPWVKEERRHLTLRKRLYALIEGCDVALALPGGIGTLAEISVMWSQLQVGEGFSVPLILIGSEWAEMIKTFQSLLGDYIAEEDRDLLFFSPNVNSAATLLSVLVNGHTP
jgi:predicted Rossmann-fold nucleotide-binding protein